MAYVKGVVARAMLGKTWREAAGQHRPWWSFANDNTHQNRLGLAYLNIFCLYLLAPFDTPANNMKGDTVECEARTRARQGGAGGARCVRLAGRLHDCSLGPTILPTEPNRH